MREVMLLRLIVALSLVLNGVSAAADEIDFNRDIRPILADACFHCHGPDAATREAELRLDREDSAKEDRGGYAAVVAGDTERSALIERIFAEDPAMRMPPPEADRSLTDAQRQLLRRWIESGAEWARHWSFVPPRRPPLPGVRRSDWVQNPIDHFILARLQREGLSPAERADPATLLRRVTLDLTGLPPSPAEIDAFRADPSPGAYLRVVDRLLQSPAYGEHMAVMWLDAARYADTDGYQNDGPRSMWRWRDWVIAAYNRNMPFDRFSVEQLAGDLLPDASLEQQIATGFNRNHRYNSEAGLVLEEFLLENAVDRLDTTATVWMGLTMGCARCHDHKYDPISQRDYYQMLAYFDNVSESGRAVKFGNSEPWVVAPTADQQRQLERMDGRIRRAAAALRDAAPEITRALEQLPPEGIDSNPPLVRDGLVHHFPLDAQGDARIEAGSPHFSGAVREQGIVCDGDSVLDLGAVGDVQCHQRSTITFWLRPDDVQQGVVLSRQTANTRRPGLAVELRDGRLQFYIITRWLAGVGAIETQQVLPAGRWVHVALSNDGSQSTRGMQIYLDGKRVPTRTLYNTNSNTGGTEKSARLRVGGGVHGPRFRGALDELRFYSRTLYDDEIDLLAEPLAAEQLLGMSAAQRSARQQAALQAWYLEHAAPVELRRLAERFAAARAARRQFYDTLPTSMVMEEMDPPRTTYLRLRGEYDQHGPVVERALPDWLAVQPSDAPPNRLGFARWLLSGDHPLTARVAVNRYWQRYFGTGLVKTAEDFGLQGELPSHPELLDWLATEFVHSGWDVKAMQRLIVTSATYQQASHVSPELLERDPQNRLLARAPRRRWSAHVIRDQALAVAGLLCGPVGGPSVSPYQPEGLWRELSNMRYTPSRGADLYRRSLYTIWKRTVAPPTMAILDAADRETCAVRSKTTNTPLQALTVLNERTFVEAARHLAMRMHREGGQRPIEFGFLLATGRSPRAAELEMLRQARAEYLAEFRHAPQAAARLIAVGEMPVAEGIDSIALAADTALANVLLNLDEVLTKE